MAEALKRSDVDGVSDDVIRKFLRGVSKPRLDALEALSKFLGVRASWLAFGEGPMLDDEYAIHSTPLYLIKAPASEAERPREVRESFKANFKGKARTEYLRLRPFEKVCLGFLLARVIEREGSRRRHADDRGRLAASLVTRILEETLKMGQKREGTRNIRRDSRAWKTQFVHALTILLYHWEGKKGEMFRER